MSGDKALFTHTQPIGREGLFPREIERERRRRPGTLEFEQTRSLDGERRLTILRSLPSYRWQHFCTKESIFHFQTPNDIYWTFGVF